jgi:hypothetical protein
MKSIHIRQNLLLLALLSQLVGISMFVMSYYCASILALDTSMVLIYVQAVITLVLIITGIGKSLECFWALIHIAWYAQREEYLLTHQGYLFLIGLGLVILSVVTYPFAVRGNADQLSDPYVDIAGLLFPFILIEALGLILILALMILLAFDDGRGWGPSFG